MRWASAFLKFSDANKGSGTNFVNYKPQQNELFGHTDNTFIIEDRQRV